MLAQSQESFNGATVQEIQQCLTLLKQALHCPIWFVLLVYKDIKLV